MADKLAVEKVGNRGTDDVAYGYVYFNDGSRVGYASKHGIFPGNWSSSDEPNTMAHANLAREALTERGFLDDGVFLKEGSAWAE